jgi:hypothetical protein
LRAQTRTCWPGAEKPTALDRRLNRVFERFESHTLGTRHRGVGLGLSIVRSFVELHGGPFPGDRDDAPGAILARGLFGPRGLFGRRQMGLAVADRERTGP